MGQELFKVKLRDGFLRNYVDYDTDFDICRGEIKVIKAQTMKSNSIRQLLFMGDLVLLEGKTTFPLRAGKITIEGGIRYAKIEEDGKIHYRDLVTKQFLDKLPTQEDIHSTKSLIVPETNVVAQTILPSQPLEISMKEGN